MLHVRVVPDWFKELDRALDFIESAPTAPTAVGGSGKGEKKEDGNVLPQSVNYPFTKAEV